MLLYAIWCRLRICTSCLQQGRTPLTAIPMQLAFKDIEKEAKLRPFARLALAQDSVLDPQTAAKIATSTWLLGFSQQLEEDAELLEVLSPIPVSPATVSLSPANMQLLRSSTCSCCRLTARSLCACVLAGNMHGLCCMHCTCLLHRSVTNSSLDTDSTVGASTAAIPA